MYALLDLLEVISCRGADMGSALVPEEQRHESTEYR